MPVALSQVLLRSQAGLILDGGLATRLEAHGAHLDHPLWSARVLTEHPELIRTVHHEFLDAGADIIASATYQASFAGFAASGLSRGEAMQCMELAVRLGREACASFSTPQSPRWLAGSLGSYGAVLCDGAEYRGDFEVTTRFLRDFHLERANVLIQAGCDLLAFETIPCLREAEALAEVALRLPDVPIWVSFHTRDARHVGHGETLTSCVTCLAGIANVFAIGVNCIPPSRVTENLKILRPATKKHLFVYPNRGEAWDAQNRAWVEQEHRIPWQQYARQWRKLGASGVGGCCRTGPEEIRALAAELQ